MSLQDKFQKGRGKGGGVERTILYRIPSDEGGRNGQ